MSDDRIVLIEPASSAKQHFVTLDEAILEGLKHPKPFVDRKLRPGEAKTKIAVSTTPLHSIFSCWVIDESLTVLQLIIRDNRETQGMLCF